MEADQPEFVLHEAFIGNFWKGHGLGRPILGTKETVKKFTREMLLDYYNRAYTPRTSRSRQRETWSTTRS